MRSFSPVPTSTLSPLSPMIVPDTSVTLTVMVWRSERLPSEALHLHDVAVVAALVGRRLEVRRGHE